jgi:hypothetical protein
MSVPLIASLARTTLAAGRIAGLAISLTLFLEACGEADALRVARRQVDSLQSRLCATRAFLDSLKTQPDRLLAEARGS